MEGKEEDTSDKTTVAWCAKNYYAATPELPYSVILLNKSITEASVGSVRQWWNNAHLRICVDGATNNFHRLMQQQQEPTSVSSPASCPLPDAISGDFDSACPELLKLYAAKGVLVHPTPNQDETDFTKSLRVLASLLEERQTAVSHVLVVAGIDGSRFDHVMAIVATLYKACKIVPAPVVVVSGGSLFWVLGTGQHSIRVPGELCHHPSASWCGLVPVGQPATVTTTGLKWNLDHQSLAFGQLVSTSNTYNLPPNGGEVTVTTSSPLLWTMGWKAELPDPGLSLPECSNLQNGDLDATSEEGK